MNKRRLKKIDHNTVVRCNPNQVFSVIDEEVVFLDLNEFSYFNLNNSGSDIWKILGSETSVEELVRKLQRLYNVSREDCMNDVLDFLSKAVSLGIIEIVK